MKWFVKCIKNYVNFRGRARRAEYWNFILFSLIFYVVAKILDMMLFSSNTEVITTLFSLFIFLPQLAVQVRRLHDTGRSGMRILWLYIAAFVWIVALLITGFSNLAALMSGSIYGMPLSFLAVLFVGMLTLLAWGIFFFMWFIIEGDKGENKYGPDPKAEVQ